MPWRSLDAWTGQSAKSQVSKGAAVSQFAVSRAVLLLLLLPSPTHRQGRKGGRERERERKKKKKGRSAGGGAAGPRYNRQR